MSLLIDPGKLSRLGGVDIGGAGTNLFTIYILDKLTVSFGVFNIVNNQSGTGYVINAQVLNASGATVNV